MGVAHSYCNELLPLRTPEFKFQKLLQMDTNTNQLCRGVTNAPRVYQPTWIQHGKLTVDQAGLVLTIATIASPDFKYSLDQSASCFPFFFSSMILIGLLQCNRPQPSNRMCFNTIRYIPQILLLGVKLYDV